MLQYPLRLTVDGSNVISIRDAHGVSIMIGSPERTGPFGYENSMVLIREMVDAANKAHYLQSFAANAFKGLQS